MTERGRLLMAVTSFVMAIVLVTAMPTPAEARKQVECNGTNSAKCDEGANEHDFGLFGGAVYLCSPNDCHWDYKPGYCHEYHSVCDQ